MFFLFFIARVFGIITAEISRALENGQISRETTEHRSFTGRQGLTQHVRKKSSYISEKWRGLPTLN